MPMVHDYALVAPNNAARRVLLAGVETSCIMTSAPLRSKCVAHSRHALVTESTIDLPPVWTQT